MFDGSKYVARSKEVPFQELNYIRRI